MPETIPKIYQNLTEQDRLEADYNLVGLYGLLLKIDKRIKAEQTNNLMKGTNNGQEKARQ